MRWSRNLSASWAERFRTSSFICTYKLCDYYSPIPILSPFLFTPSLYAPILNLQEFSFTCKMCFAMNYQSLSKLESVLKNPDYGWFALPYICKLQLYALLLAKVGQRPGCYWLRKLESRTF